MYTLLIYILFEIINEKLPYQPVIISFFSEKPFLRITKVQEQLFGTLATQPALEKE